MSSVRKSNSLYEDAHSVISYPPSDSPTLPPLYSYSLTSSTSPLITYKFSILTPWLTLFLVFIPLGYVAHGNQWSDTWVFILNFLAIIPLAVLFEFAINDISLRFGRTIGDLLNATFGNMVEIIISITALKDGKIRIAQASILGSIILNLLLLLGINFTKGGISSKTQKFNQTAAQTNSSLMALACIALIIPAAFVSSIDIDFSSDEHNGKLLKLSYGTAIVLLIIYCLYLFFQLKTHSHLFQREKEDKEPQLSLIVSIFLLATVTVAVAFSEFLVGSIEGVVTAYSISETFIGLIILPIVNKSAELLNIFNAVAEGEADLDSTINLAAGSSMHIAYFVSPLLVILGWITGQQMTLFFQVFETVILFISVMMTNYLVQNGESNWLKGVLFLATYVIIAIAFFFYPSDLHK